VKSFDLSQVDAQIWNKWRKKSKDDWGLWYIENGHLQLSHILLRHKVHRKLVTQHWFWCSSLWTLVTLAACFVLQHKVTSHKKGVVWNIRFVTSFLKYMPKNYWNWFVTNSHCKTKKCAVFL